MKYSFLLLFLFISATAFPQKREHYLPLGLGWSLQHAQDEGMSPLQYNGSSLSVKTGYIVKTPNNKHQLDLMFHYGKLHTRNFNKTESFKVPMYRFDLSYTYLKLLKRFGNDKYALYLGGRSEFTGNIRLNYKLGNSTVNYEGIAALGISSGLSRTFEINKRKLLLDFYFNLPFLSYVIRPNYITITDFSDPDNDVVKDHTKRVTFNSFNKFTRATIQLDASYLLKNGNMIRLGYLWDFYSYRRTNKVKAALQGIVLSTIFKF
ncbi:MAG: hypothetical protein WD048_17125 [Chitinophagales bacterium]